MKTPWWTGARGEWYVVVQMVLFVLVAIGPRTWRGWPGWPFPDGGIVSIAGWALLAAGGALAAWAAAQVGLRLSPVPYPPDGAVLRTTGAFAVVRHPMYCGSILAAVGWALVRQGWLTLLYTALLFVLFDLKSRREERWLAERFAEYPAYRTRVRRLIPFVY
jgi:protein-S-isoprenylcysteine O-methyltransferase Ste14